VYCSRQIIQAIKHEGLLRFSMAVQTILGAHTGSAATGIYFARRSNKAGAIDFTWNAECCALVTATTKGESSMPAYSAKPAVACNCEGWPKPNLLSCLSDNMHDVCPRPTLESSHYCKEYFMNRHGLFTVHCSGGECFNGEYSASLVFHQLLPEPVILVISCSKDISDPSSVHVSDIANHPLHR
jgi:hypothetical protein